MFAVLAAARDGNRLGMRIDTVFDQLRDGLKRIALRQGNDTDSIPIIADPQFSFNRTAVICGINTCGVDPSPLQSFEAKTKTCVLSILKLYLKMLICGIYLEIWAMWSYKQLGISRRWL